MMPPSQSSNTPNFSEELADGLLNAFAVIYAMFAMGLLFFHAWYHSVPERWMFQFFGGIFYAGMLAILFFYAAVYHFTRLASYRKLQVKIHDLFVYLLLLGTYVGFFFVLYPPTELPMLFYLAVGGILCAMVVRLCSRKKHENASLIVYFVLLWMGMFDYPGTPEFHDTFTYFIIGNVFYSVGLILLRLHRIPYSHLLWHMLVIGGSFFHLIAINSIFDI